MGNFSENKWNLWPDYERLWKEEMKNKKVRRKKIIDKVKKEKKKIEDI